MSMKFFAVLSAMLLPLFAGALEITQSFLLVKAEKEDLFTNRSIQLLNRSFKEMFGTPLRVVTESKWDGKTPAVVVGDSALAQKAGISKEKLDPETYVLKVNGGNLIVSGGEKGVYFAAVELLEKAGCCMPAMESLYIPHQKSFTLPDSLNLSRAPAMHSRGIYIGRENSDFYLWNKLNGEGDKDFEVRVIGGSHSFWNLSKDFPADKPELFALNEKGKRERSAKGQLCLSNPETRKLMKESLRKLIEKTEKDTVAKKLPLPEFYRLTPNDTGRGCCCAKCQEIIKKYGADSGLLLEFVNEIAAEFPDKKIVTFAYRFNRQAPKPGSIVPRKNVYIEITLQSIEWGDGETRSLLQPWEAPGNEQARKQFLEWKTFTPNLLVWDYNKLYQQTQCIPYTAAPALIANIPFYAKNRIKGIFTENEMGSWRGSSLSLHAFQELEIYLFCKLTDDPSRDCGKLLDRYFKAYYRQSAPFMRKYYDLLTDAMKKDPPDETKSFSEWKYLSADFFKQAYALLDQAVKAAGNDMELQKRIRFEMVPLDTALLVLWTQFKAQNVKFAFSRKDVEQRLTKASETVVARYFPYSAVNEKQRLVSLMTPDGIRNLPAGVELEDVRIVTVSDAPIRKDADAERGSSCQLDKKAGHSNPPLFGVYDPPTKKYLTSPVRLKEYPQDEKFHLYFIGRCTIPSGSAYIFCHNSWRMIFRLAALFSADMANKPMDIYVSAKFQGPSYVKGSAKDDCFAVEHVLLVPAKGKPKSIGLVK